MKSALFFSRLICLLLLLTSFFSQAANTSHLRGKRYCEIIIAKQLTRYQVYNTWGLNDCPQKIWTKISALQVKKETGARFVHLNGPRYWTIDGFEHTDLINPTVKTIDGLALREAGVLHLGIFSLHTNKPYHQHEVTRHTTWVYAAGKPIYELIASNGDVFVMQSYSTQDKPQTIQSLSRLGAQLTLPEGWRFKTGTLKHQEKLIATNNMAVVIQDDFFNTYQKSTHDFLQ